MFVKEFLTGMSRIVFIVLWITLLIWGWVGFKKVEPFFFPVVEPIKIKEVKFDEDTVSIRGELNKVRDCEFKSLAAYSDNYLLSFKFTEVDSIVDRVKGKQYFGWWVFTPSVDNIEIYSRHTCSTGTVVTKIYEGFLHAK